MSMVNPSIDKLATMVDSKYTLAILAAKRARELTKPGHVLPEKEGRSFAGEVGGSLDSGVEDAKARIIENSTPGGGVEGDKTGEDVFIVFE